MCSDWRRHCLADELQSAKDRRVIISRVTQS